MFNFQKEPSLYYEHSVGGFTINISLLGNMPLHKSFLQSPCFKQCPSATAIDTSKQQAVAPITGAYLSLRDHDCCSRFLSATIHDFVGLDYHMYHALP